MSGVHRPGIRGSSLALLLLLVLIAGVEFLSRSMLRGHGGNDFATPFVSTTRFLHRSNPYTPTGFLDDWHRNAAPENRGVVLAGQYSIYPPITLVVCVPFALLPWEAALLVYKILAAVMYIGVVYFLGCKIGTAWRSPARLGFVAFALAITSVHAGIHQGNLSVMAFTLCAAGLLFAERDNEAIAGVLLALGFCLKPTTAAAIVLVIFLYGRKKTLIVALVTGLTIAGAAFLQMARIDPAWRTDYQNNLAYMFGPSGGSSFITESQGRFDLLNLQVPLYALLRNAMAANVVAWGISLLLVAAWFYLFFVSRSPGKAWNWLAIGSISLIGLLPFYQRNYNVAVVIFVLLWAFQNLRLLVAKMILLLCGFFLVPGEALLRRLGAEHALEHNLAWNVVVMSQATWAICAIVCLLLYAQSRREKYL